MSGGEATERERGAEGGGRRRVTSAHAACHGVYLHAKVHFVQIYNYGFPGRQVPVPEDSEAGEWLQERPRYLPPYLASCRPHQPVQPFGRARSLPSSAFNYFAPDGIYA